MKFETYIPALERLGNGSWYAEVNARRVGIDMHAHLRRFNAPTHAALFNQIVGWFDEMFPELGPQKPLRASVVSRSSEPPSDASVAEESTQGALETIWSS